MAHNLTPAAITKCFSPADGQKHILRGVYHEPTAEILRFAQNDMFLGGGASRALLHDPALG
jgi:hypothetical protein